MRQRIKITPINNCVYSTRPIMELIIKRKKKRVKNKRRQDKKVYQSTGIITFTDPCLI